MPDIFCVSGHQLPQLILLGAQKCATTSFAMELKAWGFRSSQKEVHFFDHHKASSGLAAYAKNFPSCGGSTFDATPNHLLPYVAKFAAADFARLYGKERMAKTFSRMPDLVKRSTLGPACDYKCTVSNLARTRQSM